MWMGFFRLKVHGTADRQHTLYGKCSPLYSVHTYEVHTEYMYRLVTTECSIHPHIQENKERERQSSCLLPPASYFLHKRQFSKKSTDLIDPASVLLFLCQFCSLHMKIT